MCAEFEHLNQSMADMTFIKALAEVAKPATGEEDPFMVMTQVDFQAMSASEIQHIFKRKHIIVNGMEHDNMMFDRRGLERVGNWDELRTLQGILSS